MIAAAAKTPLLTNMLARSPTRAAKAPVMSGAKKLTRRPQLKIDEAVDFR